MRSQTVNQLLYVTGSFLGRAAGSIEPGTLTAREELITFATMLKKVGFPSRAPRLPPASTIPVVRSSSRSPALTSCTGRMPLAPQSSASCEYGSDLGLPPLAFFEFDRMVCGS